jgi:hypothetical protein
MPENEVQNMQAPEAASVSETKAAKFERERYTRRQALRKFGLTTAMATFAMFSVDDLAHMVGNALQQHAGDSQVAEQVAKEFQQAGVVLANSPGSTSSSAKSKCQHCCNEVYKNVCWCYQQYCKEDSSSANCKACENSSQNYCEKCLNSPACPNHKCKAILKSCGGVVGLPPPGFN